MGTPLPDYIADAAYDFAGLTIADYVRQHVKPSQRILDIGAGWGKYRWILPEYEMDAVEVWQPYVEQEKLDAYYRKVFIQDIRDFRFSERYPMVIMGDVLEHIPSEDAQRVVQYICDNCDYLIVATPFEMKQSAVDGNKHEFHEQADLNEAVMTERYPMLELHSLSPLVENTHRKAIYIKGGDST